MRGRRPDDLGDFRGTARLFPLPGVVLFPGVVLPLHMFEPRYRLLTEHAIRTDRLMVLVQARSPALIEPPSEREVEPVGCLGRIIGHEPLADGRRNLLLLGLRRCHILRELPRTRLYREAEVELLEDLESEPDDPSGRARLVARFRDHLGTRRFLDPDLESILDSEIPTGTLADILSHALGLPSEIQQRLLNERRVSRRIDLLLGLIGPATARDATTRNREPPPPSKHDRPDDRPGPA